MVERKRDRTGNAAPGRGSDLATGWGAGEDMLTSSPGTHRQYSGPYPAASEQSNTPLSVVNISSGNSSPMRLTQQEQTHTTAGGAKRGVPDSTEVEDESREEGGTRQRVRLGTDLEKAHLIRLCINNFGRYEGARGKFFQSIGQLFEKEFNTKALDVPMWEVG